MTDSPVKFVSGGDTAFDALLIALATQLTPEVGEALNAYCEERDAAAAELEALRAEGCALSAEIGRCCPARFDPVVGGECEDSRSCPQLDALRQRERQLIEALEEYGEHDRTCIVGQWQPVRRLRR